MFHKQSSPHHKVKRITFISFIILGSFFSILGHFYNDNDSVSNLAFASSCREIRIRAGQEIPLNAVESLEVCQGCGNPSNNGQYFCGSKNTCIQCANGGIISVDLINCANKSCGGYSCTTPSGTTIGNNEYGWYNQQQTICGKCDAGVMTQVNSSFCAQALLPDPGCISTNSLVIRSKRWCKDGRTLANCDENGKFTTTSCNGNQGCYSSNSPGAVDGVMCSTTNLNPTPTRSLPIISSSPRPTITPVVSSDCNKNGTILKNTSYCKSNNILISCDGDGKATFKICSTSGGMYCNSSTTSCSLIPTPTPTLRQTSPTPTPNLLCQTGGIDRSGTSFCYSLSRSIRCGDNKILISDDHCYTGCDTKTGICIPLTPTPTRLPTPTRTPTPTIATHPMCANHKSEVYCTGDTMYFCDSEGKLDKTISCGVRKCNEAGTECNSSSPTATPRAIAPTPTQRPLSACEIAGHTCTHTSQGCSYLGGTKAEVPNWPGSTYSCSGSSISTGNYCCNLP